MTIGILELLGIIGKAVVNVHGWFLESGVGARWRRHP